jgi:hypothetical protein
MLKVVIVCAFHFIKTNFPLTPKMLLTVEEVELCAYIFHPNNDADEDLFKMGEFTAHRGLILTLCPQRVVDNKVIP